MRATISHMSCAVPFFDETCGPAMGVTTGEGVRERQDRSTNALEIQFVYHVYIYIYIYIYFVAFTARLASCGCLVDITRSRFSVPSSVVLIVNPPWRILRSGRYHDCSSAFIFFDLSVTMSSSGSISCFASVLQRARVRI